MLHLWPPWPGLQLSGLPGPRLQVEATRLKNSYQFMASYFTTYESTWSFIHYTLCWVKPNLKSRSLPWCTCSSARPCCHDWTSSCQSISATHRNSKLSKQQKLQKEKVKKYEKSWIITFLMCFYITFPTWSQLFSVLFPNKTAQHSAGFFFQPPRTWRSVETPRGRAPRVPCCGREWYKRHMFCHYWYV